MGNRYQDRHQYFDELVETSTAFYVDYIRRFILIADGTRILEVGCGEGGNLLPFALIGCEVTGVDFSAKKIENARNYFQINGADGAFFCADFFISGPGRCGLPGFPGLADAFRWPSADLFQ